MQNEVSYIVDKAVDITPIATSREDEQYLAFLSNYEVEYEVVDYYLQVGKINQVQGWILHISVVIAQLIDFLKKAIPLLLNERISFKIPLSITVARRISGGSYGYHKLGKVICVYSENENKAAIIAKKLVELSVNYKGIDIPTDKHLGGIVYTRYGSFNPVMKMDDNGVYHRYIYNHLGGLIKDEYLVPYVLPNQINWPFSELKTADNTEIKKLFNGLIKPIEVIKYDIKGNVIKGIYLKHLFRVKKCIIKQGKQNTLLDNHGRDIQDRLLWQKELHQYLEHKLPLPRILDFFKENHDTFLVMEFIKGVSLDDEIVKHLSGNVWQNLPQITQIRLLNYLLQIINIVALLHDNGVIHRDIMPVNFIINSKEHLYLIDLELAYSIVARRPDPPFKLGTEGFMSPEQSIGITPTVKEDVYAVGAIMISIFTGLLPSRFETTTINTLKESLKFFIGINELIDVISNCLLADPIKRPELADIKKVILTYRDIIKTNYQRRPKIELPEFPKEELQVIINKSIEALAFTPMVNENNLWFSNPMQNQDVIMGNQIMNSTHFAGLYGGLSGTQYLLSQAKKAGFLIDSCKICFEKSSHYIETNYLEKLSIIPKGLYQGAAGIALALAANIQSNIADINAKNISYMKECLQPELSGYDIATGAAGQGIALLYCAEFLENSFIENKLHNICQYLIDNQQSDGSWFYKIGNDSQDKGKIKITGLDFGVAGIIQFLIKYSQVYSNEEAIKSVYRALHWLQKVAIKKGGHFIWPISNKNRFNDKWLSAGNTGIALTFLKAYDWLKEPLFKKISEEALLVHSDNLIARNLTLFHGLAGVGEVYLVAYGITGNEEWKYRANWILQSLYHLRKINSEGYVSWQTDTINNVIAPDFMTGNSGVIHFLIRYYLTMENMKSTIVKLVYE